MERAGVILLLLLILPVCTAFRIPASFAWFGRRDRDSSMIAGKGKEFDSFSATTGTNAFHQFRKENGADELLAGDEDDACKGHQGLKLAECRTEHYARILAQFDDYPPVSANVNVILAPFPS